MPHDTRNVPTPPSEESDGDGPHASILVVEDEEVVRDVLGEVLELGGYECDTAVDGEEGLARVEATRGDYDLIYSNLDMPRMRGDAFLAAIQPLVAGRVPRILGSGSTRDWFAPMALRTGACDILEYPFCVNELLDKVAWGLHVRAAYARCSAPLTPEEEPAYLFRWSLEAGVRTTLYRLPVLLDLLQGDDPDAARAACAALGGLAALSVPLPAWVDALLASKAPLVRVQAARAVGGQTSRLKAALHVLEPALRHPDRGVADIALTALREVLSVRH